MLQPEVCDHKRQQLVGEAAGRLVRVLGPYWHPLILGSLSGLVIMALQRMTLRRQLEKQETKSKVPPCPFCQVFLRYLGLFTT